MSTSSTAMHTLEAWHKEIEVLHTVSEYRPTVVAILRNVDGRFLFVESAMAANVWGMPQGGVEVGESLIDALSRELSEETGVHPVAYEVVRLVCVNQLDIPRPRGNFSKGKRYYFMFCQCRAEPTIVLDERENAAYRWMHRESVEDLLSGVTPEKRESLMEALRLV